MNQLQKRLHDARLAVERWLLVTVFRYPPEFVDAVVATDEARLEYVRRLDAFAQERLKLERARDELQTRIERMVWEAAQIRATRERLIAESQRGDQPFWMQVWARDMMIPKLQRREDEIVAEINRGHAIADQVRTTAVRLEVAEACARIADALH